MREKSHSTSVMHSANVLKIQFAENLYSLIKVCMCNIYITQRISSIQDVNDCKNVEDLDVLALHFQICELIS